MIGEAAILFVGFLFLAALRVPIAFALILGGLLLFPTDERLMAWQLPQNLVGGIDSFVLLAVPFFVLAGHIMNESKVTDRLVRLAHAIVGAVRGGLGMVNVGVSMLFAGVSGSSTADTAGVGSVLIPQMKERGYTPEFAVAVTASSSVIGSIIPPSIQLIVWGSLTSTSIAALFLGGVIPGTLIGLGLLALVYALARRHHLPSEERLSLRQVAVAARDSLLALGVPLIVIGGIVLGYVTATEAAVLAVLYALVLGLAVYRTITIRDLPRLFSASADLSALPLFALAAAGLFGFLLAYQEIPGLLEGFLGGVSAAAVLPVLALLWVVLGTFLDALPAMAIMIPVFGPVVDAAGINPVHYGVVSVMALSLGLITPPYGLCLLLASAIGRIPVMKAVTAIGWFIALIAGVVLLCIAFPQLVTLLPDALVDY
jgi:tripartite ATP-independent transporter DctM subunit